MATRNKPGTAIMPWEEQMRKAVQAQKAVEKPAQAGFRKLSIRGGILALGEDQIADNTLDVVVLLSVHENQYYTSEFVEGRPTVPACYAFSDPDAEDEEVEERMANHVKCDDPQGQEDPNEAGVREGPCVTCWANKFGTADKGRGKACKNVRRMALITGEEAVELEALKAAEVCTLSVPVMSGKNWAKYVRDVLSDEVQRPYYAVVTTIKLVPDRKAQYLLTFEFKELINFDAALWEAMQKKIAEVKPQLTAPYPSQEELDSMREADAAAQKAAGKGGRGQPMRPVGRVAQKAVAPKAGAKAPAKTAPGKPKKF